MQLIEITWVMSLNDAVISGLPLTFDIATVTVLDAIRERIRGMCLMDEKFMSLTSIKLLLGTWRLEIYCDKASNMMFFPVQRYCAIKVGLYFAFDMRGVTALKLKRQSERACKEKKSLNGLLRSTKITIFQSHCLWKRHILSSSVSRNNKIDSLSADITLNNKINHCKKNVLQPKVSYESELRWTQCFNNHAKWSKGDVRSISSTGGSLLAIYFYFL